MASDEQNDPDGWGPPPTLNARLRFGWGALWVSLMTVPASIGQIAAHRRDPSPGTFYRWAGRWGRSSLHGLGVRVDLQMNARLDAARPHVFIANHQVAADILALAAALPQAFGFIAKAELKRVPLMSTAIRHSPSIYIDRSTPRRSLESMREAGRRIRAGTSVLVFPEGARSYSPVMGPFKRGAFLLAIEAGVPVVPVTILNAYRLLNEQDKVAAGGTIRMVLDAPIPTEGLRRGDALALANQVRAVMEGRLEEYVSSLSKAEKERARAERQRQAPLDPNDY